MNFYKFKYETRPKLRFVSEKEIPICLLTEYHKRKNLQVKTLVGSINACNISKELPCFNKSQTKGMYFILKRIKYSAVI